MFPFRRSIISIVLIFEKLSEFIFLENIIYWYDTVFIEKNCFKQVFMLIFLYLYK